MWLFAQASDARIGLEAALLGVWGWGALLLIAGILLGLLVGALISGSIGSDIKTGRKVENPKNCQEATDIKNALLKDKEQAEKARKDLEGQRTAAIATLVAATTVATAAAIGAVATAGLPIVGVVLGVVAGLAAATATAAGVVLAKLNEVIGKVDEYIKFLGDLLDLAEQLVRSLCS